MCSATKCLKVTLIILNIFFWLFGLGLLALGIWIKVDPELVNIGASLGAGQSHAVFEVIAWIFIGSGIFAFIVGFFGCCGAVRESRVLLGFYIFCMAVVFAAEIAIAVIIGVYGIDRIRSEFEVGVKSWIRNEYDEESIASRGFNYVQIEFCCCGYKDYRDYAGSQIMNKTKIRKDATLSLACCKPSSETEKYSTTINAENREKCEEDASKMAGQGPAGESRCDEDFRASGCADKLITWAQKHMIGLIVVGAGVALVEVIVFIIAVCLCIQISREEKDF